MKTCSLPGCSRPHYARTWCEAHYKRWRKTGDTRPDEPVDMYGPERVARVAAKLTGKTYGPRPEAWRAAISAAKKGRSNGLEGRPKSPETRAKIAAAHTGTRSANWKGDDVGYIALHERARKVMASECAHCGTTERLEAALRKDAAGPLKHATMRIAGKDRDMTYSTTLSDYMALCVPCHRVYDLKAS